MLRPVRDAMASDWTNAELATLMTIQFFLSTAAVLIWGFVISKLPFKHLVPSIYAFFSFSFLALYVAVRSTANTELFDKAFFVWISVFSLFHLSVFWSFMSDLFKREQAGRFFGIIAAGASSGAMAGPLIPGLLSDLIGTYNLILISSVMIFLVVPAIVYLQDLKASELHNEEVHADLSSFKIGGNLGQGFKIFFNNPYILSIGIFIILYSGISSFIYYEQKTLLAEFTRSERQTILAWIEFTVNGLTLFTQFFATARIIRRFGLKVTLPLIPVVVAVGMFFLALSPILAFLIPLQVARKVGNHSITRPSREMLFTHVDRETRFKAKPVIDIVAYRGGDMMMGWVFTGLTTGLGAGLAAVSLIGSGMALAWAAIGLYLGRWFDRDESAGELKAHVEELVPQIPNGATDDG